MESERPMLIKLTTDQISFYWPLIRRSLEETLPPIARGGPAYFQNILRQCLTDAKQVWIGSLENEPIFVGLTEELINSDDDSRSLLIYSFYAIAKQDYPIGLWYTFYCTIAKYMQSKKLTRLVAYTNNEKMKHAAARIGFNTEWTLLTMEVKDE